MLRLDRIKELAKEKHISISAVNRDYGEEPGYLNKVAAGSRRITQDRIDYIAKCLGTSSAYIMDETDDPAPPQNHRTAMFHYARYDELRKERNLTPNYVERQIGLPYGYMDSFNELSTKEVYKLAILLNTTYEYLMGLTDDPRVPDNDRTGVKIKVFGEVAAGIPIQQIDNFDPDDTDSWEEINRKTAKSGTYFALRIKGQSMSPEIRDGAVVIVRKQDTIESGELAVVAINGDTATCKKVVLDKNGMYLMPINPAFPPLFFSVEQVKSLPVRILGKVVEARNKYE